ncbi:MAG: hypothetical protein Q8R50_01080 [Sediminibacterium sp.]|nr:hypothetical protein [Sediminibacterium sp.]
MDNLQNDIALFFRHPNDFDGKATIHSTLYLLRRDTSMCFGYDPNNNQKINFEALFPATMAVMAGIDLVAKFLYADTKNEVSKRFTDYVVKYIDKNFSEELFQLRNSIVHSFGLYSEGKGGKIYHFILTRGIGKLIQKVNEKTYYVDIEILWNKFEESIELYQQELSNSTDLQQIFIDMFPKYGTGTIK